MSEKKRSFTEFSTLSNSNKGVTLTIPNTGGETITVLGTDSDTAKKAQADIIRSLRDLPEDKATSEQEELEQSERNRLEFLSSLVVGWSFKEECNKQNVLAFLTQSPFVANFVDIEAAKISNFMGKPVKD